MEVLPNIQSCFHTLTAGYSELHAQVPAARSYHPSEGLQPVRFEKGFILHLRLSRDSIHGSDCLSKPEGEFKLLMTYSWVQIAHLGNEKDDLAW